ncbi:MAG: hypothetical protein C0443_01515 [Comamonadaceae bacterium]|nr:hypothetical protein [Comamonadaceae bacterium]
MVDVTRRSVARGRRALHWRDFSIVHKLGLLQALNTLVAVVLIALVFSVGNAITRYHHNQKQLQALAQVIGEHSRAALAFGDRQSAQTILAALRATNEIELVRLLDERGVLFARADFSGHRPHQGTFQERLVSSVFPTHLSVSYSITDEGKEVGRVNSRHTCCTSGSTCSRARP